MPKSDSSGWFLRYDDPKSDERLLVSFPANMLRDVRVLAGGLGVSSAELIRRAVTREIAFYAASHPEVAKSFRGKPL